MMIGKHCPPLSELPSPVFILGPAYSGKSDIAPEALDRTCATTVLGMAGLSELEDRIKALKAQRPSHWQHNESSSLNEGLVAAFEASEQVLVDSVNQWLANFLLEGWSKYDLKQQDARIDLELRKFILQLEQHPHKRIVIVSSEIGAGVSPPQELSRFFRQALGRTHVALAQKAGSVVHIIAGIPSLLKP
ncbi:MAG: bifunctional adenosylcobinamide kinase/adenosylcobinamide-phosphate guanylyltransferase [Chitinophagaceae bacterium]|nr:bifunctional adenosylcobinamide kinase/adenosylcobinamide-phosphate guanylyltransferase [Oligoflexus sp.]